MGPSGWPPSYGAVERKGKRDKDHRFWQSWADSLLFPLPGLSEQETRASEGKPTYIWIPAPPPLLSLNSLLVGGNTNFGSPCYKLNDLKHKRTQPKAGTQRMFWFPHPLPKKGFHQRMDPLPRPPPRAQCHFLPGPNTPGMLLRKNWKFHDPTAVFIFTD